MIDDMSTETTVESTWRRMLEHHSAARRSGSPEVIEAAAAEPRLRQLFPFLSHGCLTFHRNTAYPWSNDLPFIACTTPYKVYATGYAELLGETETAQEAAALVVAHLPRDCGPAVEGPWPQPGSDPE
ncbi:DUF6193 family natural product biosynthesis protein [Streptomyces angustmyceticus]|uniref:DUF6193 family natural product biosynthesis protein n=1 Tax=Streptomyces angustmyceticus TaxID=285578 RepID=UPI00380C5E4A